MKLDEHLKNESQTYFASWAEAGFYRCVDQREGGELNEVHTQKAGSRETRARQTIGTAIDTA